MIRYISLLLIVFLVNACATSNRSNFSKRKHLKGHFWNLKEKYKTSNSNGEREDYSLVETKKSEDKIQKSSESIAVADDYIVESVSGELVEIEESVKLENTRVEDGEGQEQQDSAQIEESVSSSHDQHQTKQRPSKSDFTILVVLLLILGLIFWFGVIGLIVTLFLQIFSAIIPWLFYTSLIIVGVFVLLFIGLVIGL